MLTAKLGLFGRRVMSAQRLDLHLMFSFIEVAVHRVVSGHVVVYSGAG
jgi:hypothetical protein